MKKTESTIASNLTQKPILSRFIIIAGYPPKSLGIGPIVYQQNYHFVNRSPHLSRFSPGLLVLAPTDIACRPQPQRGVGRLHRLPHHPDQFPAQGDEIRLVAQPGRETFERPGRVVPAPVETTVNERLYAAPQRSE